MESSLARPGENQEKPAGTQRLWSREAERHRGGCAQGTGREEGSKSPGSQEESASLMKGPFFPGDYKNIHDP